MRDLQLGAFLHQEVHPGRASRNHFKYSSKAQSRRPATQASAGKKRDSGTASLPAGGTHRPRLQRAVVKWTIGRLLSACLRPEGTARAVAAPINIEYLRFIG